MKRFNVSGEINVRGTYDFVILANDEDEAIEKARDIVANKVNVVMEVDEGSIDLEITDGDDWAYDEDDDWEDEEENETPSLEQIIKYIEILDFQNIQQQGQDSHAAYFEASDGNTEFELKYVYETGGIYCREKGLEDWQFLA